MESEVREDMMANVNSGRGNTKVLLRWSEGERENEISGAKKQQEKYKEAKEGSGLTLHSIFIFPRPYRGISLPSSPGSSLARS
ncbi:Hypothetical protein NTJ_03645 [Nesidiocoris tenuis]|uniref:Uncharacterized protein n=1 Tax=Nesidiocoris tenuis TaxID=355587 RepID=A0ABN7AEX9_9HEMI|nr:Hypothetical protein NTJ_03645 [Nesidiocoris tenuis]